MHSWRRQTPDDADEWLAGFRSLGQGGSNSAGGGTQRRLSLRMLRLVPLPDALPKVLTELLLDEVCDDDQDL